MNARRENPFCNLLCNQDHMSFLELKNLHVKSKLYPSWQYWAKESVERPGYKGGYEGRYKEREYYLFREGCVIFSKENILK